MESRRRNAIHFRELFMKMTLIVVAGIEGGPDNLASLPDQFLAQLNSLLLNVGIRGKSNAVTEDSLKMKLAQVAGMGKRVDG